MPNGPRYPGPPIPPRSPRATRGMPGQRRDPFQYFRSEDGKIDFNKVQYTASQIRSIYSQINPMLSKFLKK